MVRIPWLGGSVYKDPVPLFVVCGTYINVGGLWFILLAKKEEIAQ